jgi:Bacterial regulatory proteins, tetR family
MSSANSKNHRKAQPSFQPKKGRPTADQVLAIERAILNAAMERFLADGYNGASMDAIAIAVGVSKGALYSRSRTISASSRDSMAVPRATHNGGRSAW